MNGREPAIDVTALDRLLEMTGGEQAFVDELIATYLEDAAGQLASLREAAAAGLPDELVRPAHSLKSNSASVGAMVLAELCRGLELDARTGQVIGAPERVDAIALELERVRTALAQPRAGS